MTTQIGFIGLGIMGAPMAANLVKAGFEVTGYNRSPGRVEQLARPAAAAPRTSPRRCGRPTWWRPWSPTPPTSRRSWPARAASSRTRRPGRWSSTSPASGRTWPPCWPPRAPSAASGCSTRRCPAARQGAIEGVLSIMVGGAAGGLRGGRAGVRRGGQDRRARRARGLGSDGQGREPAHGGRSPRAAGRSHRVPRGLRRGHRGGAAGAGRRAGRQHRAAAQGGRDAGPRFQARLPDRAARQGHGHRHRRRPRGRRGDPARRCRRAAGRVAEGAGRRRAGPFGAAQAGRAALQDDRSKKPCHG